MSVVLRVALWELEKVVKTVESWVAYWAATSVVELDVGLVDSWVVWKDVWLVVGMVVSMVDSWVVH